MRGSVYFQSGELTKYVFVEGAKKEEKLNPRHENYQKISSYKTMEAYRNVWSNFLNYLLKHWKIKNFELISSEHIVDYVMYKIEYYPSIDYLKKIISALGKLEIALKNLTKEIYGEVRDFDFSIRLSLLKEIKNLNFVSDNYRNRAYVKPISLIQNLDEPIHMLAAMMQYEGGARIEGIALIKKEQLVGVVWDDITKSKKYALINKEKGGREGIIYISLNSGELLEQHFEINKTFKINRQKYYNDIKQACIKNGEVPEGSHGFRWCFAKRRMLECAKAGLTYQESLSFVSNEMKHNRKEITSHYLCM